jgi:hypothetical protein
MGAREYRRLREIALALPEVNERTSHGAICFFVRNRRPVCYFHDDHRGDGRVSVWCPMRAGTREELVRADPERFFKPPTSARGTFESWLGIFLDPPDANDVDWDEVQAILEDAYRLVASAGLVAQLGSRLG